MAAHSVATKTDRNAQRTMGEVNADLHVVFSTPPQVSASVCVYEWMRVHAQRHSATVNVNLSRLHFSASDFNNFRFLVRNFVLDDYN